MKQDYSHIAVLLDRSGSMESIKSDVIAGFNGFLADQKVAPGEATATIVQFDSHGAPGQGVLNYDARCVFAPLAEAAALTPDTFQPRGATPLYDALGRLIDETGAALKAMGDDVRPANVIVLIITDGYENASRKETQATVAAKVKHQTDAYQWRFVYIGANQDAVQVAQQINIDPHLAMSYGANAAGVKASYMAVGASMRGLRTGMRPAAAAFSAQARSAAMGTPRKPR